MFCTKLHVILAKVGCQSVGNNDMPSNTHKHHNYDNNALAHLELVPAGHCGLGGRQACHSGRGLFRERLLQNEHTNKEKRILSVKRSPIDK